MIVSDIPVLSPSTAVYSKGKQRVQEILQVATEVLAYEGYSAFTMRNIASKQGISLRNLQYYFQTKNKLFKAVVEGMKDRELHSAKLAIEQKDMSHEDRFRAFIDYSIEDNDTTLIRGFQFELWALATRDEFAEQCRDEMTSAYCEFIYGLIKPLTPKLTAQQQRHKSAVILAMLQGSPLISGKGVSKQFKAKIAQWIKAEAFAILESSNT